MAHHRVFHRVHVEHHLEPHELDSRYHGAHSGHDHAPMQPHEVDSIDHQLMHQKPGIPDPNVNSYGEQNPYHYGNVAHPATEHQYGNSAKSLPLPTHDVNQGDSENPYSEGQDG